MGDQARPRIGWEATFKDTGSYIAGLQNLQAGTGHMTGPFSVRDTDGKNYSHLEVVLKFDGFATAPTAKEIAQILANWYNTEVDEWGNPDQTTKTADSTADVAISAVEHLAGMDAFGVATILSPSTTENVVAFARIPIPASASLACVGVWLRTATADLTNTADVHLLEVKLVRWVPDA